MNLHLLYAAIDGAHIAFLSVLAIRLLALAPRNRNAQLIALLAFGAVCAVVSARHSYMAVLPAGFAVDLGPLIIPMNLARNVTSGVLMVLCHSIFRDGRRLPLPLSAVWAVQMSLEEPLEWMAPSAWELARPHATFVLYEVVPSALQIVMLGFALAWALREPGADLVEARRKTRAVLVVVSVAHTLAPRRAPRPQCWATAHRRLLSRARRRHRPRLVGVRRHRPAAAPDSARFVDPLRPTSVATAADVSRHASDVARIRAAFESERVYRRWGSPSARSRSTSRYRSIASAVDPRRSGLQLQHAGPKRWPIPPGTTRPCSRSVRRLPVDHAFNRAFRALKGMTPTQFRARSGRTRPIPEKSGRFPKTTTASTIRRDRLVRRTVDSLAVAPGGVAMSEAEVLR